MFARTHRVFSHVPFGRLKNPKRPARRHAEGGRLTYFLWSDIHELGSVCKHETLPKSRGFAAVPSVKLIILLWQPRSVKVSWFVGGPWSQSRSQEVKNLYLLFQPKTTFWHLCCNVVNILKINGKSLTFWLCDWITSHPQITGVYP